MWRRFISPIGRFVNFRTAAVTLAGVAAVLAGGCQTTSADPDQSRGASAEEVLAAVRDTLKEPRPSIEIYKSVVSQLNTYLGLAPAEREKLKLTAAERNFIDKEIIRGDRTVALSETIEPASFLLVDAHHIDSCFLFRDLGDSVRRDFPPAPAETDAGRPAYDLELARHAFGVVIRQIQWSAPRTAVDRRAQGAWPAHNILRRGTGDAEERARVVLALLEQLKIDAGVVTRRTYRDAGDRDGIPVPWLVGVVIDRQVYLFDPHLGKPLPHPTRQGEIATLAALRKAAEDADGFDQWMAQVYQRRPIEPAVAARQCQNPELWINVSSPALAPRNRELERWLSSDAILRGAKLYQDVEARLARCKQAEGPAVVDVWATGDLPGYVRGYPLEIMTEWARIDAQGTKLQQLVVPRGLFRSVIGRLEAALSKNHRHPERAERLYVRFDHYFLRTRLAPGGVRDTLVRGRPEQTIDMVLERERALDKAMHFIYRREDPTGRIERMGAALVASWKEFDELSQQPDNLERRAREQEIYRRIEAIWRDAETALDTLALVVGEQDLRQHLIYYMGLAKLELAVRDEMRLDREVAAIPLIERWTALETAVELARRRQEVRTQWQSAESWFRRYEAFVLPMRRNHWLPAAREHAETCREAILRLS